MTHKILFILLLCCLCVIGFKDKCRPKDYELLTNVIDENSSGYIDINFGNDSLVERTLNIPILTTVRIRNFFSERLVVFNQSEYGVCEFDESDVGDDNVLEAIEVDGDNSSQLYTLTSAIAGSVVISVNSSDLCLNHQRIVIRFLLTKCRISQNRSTCNFNGVCAEQNSTFACQCCDNFFGDYCQHVHVENKSNNVAEKVGVSVTSICPSGIACQAGGSCIDDNGRPKCLCPSGYSGKKCEVPPLTCNNTHCDNGICIIQDGKEKCFCTPGYHGNRCQFQYNDCFPNPCHNGGSCKPIIDGYECSCTVGFYGSTCSIKVDLCSPNRCQMSSKCHDIGNDYLCSCPRGLAGRHCDRNIDECEPNPCLRNGKCHDLIGGFRCQCEEGTAGQRCEFSLDIFAPPIETQISGVVSESHLHNLYIVAGVLTTAFIVTLSVLISCYVKTNRKYRLICPRRMRYRSAMRRSSTSSSLDILTINQPHLTIDAICDASSSITETRYINSDRGDPLLIKEL